MNTSRFICLALDLFFLPFIPAQAWVIDRLLQLYTLQRDLTLIALFHT